MRVIRCRMNIGDNDHVRHLGVSIALTDPARLRGRSEEDAMGPRNGAQTQSGPWSGLGRCASDPLSPSFPGVAEIVVYVKT